MDEEKLLARQFDAHRAHLRAVAYRMLGSLSEAEDAVQEAWLRLSRAHASGVENLGGWLTTIVARLCLDMLRSRKSRREEPLEAHAPETIAAPDGAAAAELEAEMADSVGLALLVVLERLAPAERLAFVLHDMFDLPFEEIAPIVGRTPTAARQLASRARRRVRGSRKVADAELGARREIVDAFLAASRGGDLNALLAALDPDVTFRADGAAMRLGASAELRGAAAVAQNFMGRAQLARAILVDGAVGILVAPHGRPLIVFNVAFAGGKISRFDMVADPERLRELDLAVIEERGVG
jgi:RNA polymerase sigma-70 factor, ECF subfamily